MEEGVCSSAEVAASICQGLHLVPHLLVELVLLIITEDGYLIKMK
jgi:hypothetical protein